MTQNDDNTKTPSTELHANAFIPAIWLLLVSLLTLHSTGIIDTSYDSYDLVGTWLAVLALPLLMLKLGIPSRKEIAAATMYIAFLCMIVTFGYVMATR
ncbi:hypothetical protein ABRZ80_20680 [Vibrio vulnificus]|uniref:hypothetical protein n=1 Tax=Vibrio vulnificus TaxID=672 RepID=UPI0032EB7D98